VIDRAADAERYEVISTGYDAHLFAAAGISGRHRVLDVGCGYGATTRRAARRAPMATSSATTWVEVGENAATAAVFMLARGAFRGAVDQIDN
jgi:trans-aconitate methyltransferase